MEIFGEGATKISALRIADPPTFKAVGLCGATPSNYIDHCNFSSLEADLFSPIGRDKAE
jgi:hypothetical protein